VNDRLEKGYPVNQCETTACRENTASILRRRARQMHEQAVRFEKLADMSDRMSHDEECAMYELVSGLR